jgi:hypothetical protein
MLYRWGIGVYIRQGEFADLPEPLIMIRNLMQIAVSIIVLIAALFVVLGRRYMPQEKHWAYGAVGTILGFWLKG